MRTTAIAVNMLLASGLALAGAAPVVAGDPAAGEGLAGACVACHGAQGRSSMPSMYPSLAGRPADELADLIRAYRDGDLQEPQMTPHVRRLSDEEIDDLAAYFSIQDPG